MSSTARGYDRHVSDYYVTPIQKIIDFLNEFKKYEPSIFSHTRNNFPILDPTSGGDTTNPMSYPEALKQLGFKDIHTIDIREDSLADVKGNYLEMELDYKPKIINH